MESLDPIQTLCLPPPQGSVVHYATSVWTRSSRNSLLESSSPFPRLIEFEAAEPREFSSLRSTLVKSIHPSSFLKLVALLAAFTLALGAQASDKHTIVRNFNASSGGTFPAGNLLRDSAGNLYGTASEGGSHNAGTIYELTPK